MPVSTALTVGGAVVFALGLIVWFLWVTLTVKYG